MKILMLNYEYPPLGGGAAPVTQAIAEKLVNKNHEVDILTMGFRDLKREEYINGVHIYRVPSLRKKQGTCTTHEMLSYCISAALKMPGLLKENRYDINHTHFIIPTGIISNLFQTTLPYLITTHGSDVPGYNPDRFGFQHTMIKPIWKKIVRNSACITSPTKYMKQLIQRNIDYNNIVIIPNGINPENFSPQEKDHKILIVSRLLERKGIQYVLEAMKDISGYNLVICGDGPYRKNLEKKTEQLKIQNKVHFRGFISHSELKKEYETSAIFILTSVSENFPVVLLEAMSAGCAVITSNTTGCREAVGNAGLLVEPTNSSDIRQKLMFLIGNDDIRKKLARNSLERIRTELNWDILIKKYITCYENILDSTSSV
jgi:glycosyltransferase involved in cell wall biosynthesis